MGQQRHVIEKTHRERGTNRVNTVVFLVEVILASLNGTFEFSFSDLGANLLREAVSGLLNGLPQLEVL